MGIQQNPEESQQDGMKWWKKAAIFVLLIACIASAAYHHKDIDPTQTAYTETTEQMPLESVEKQPSTQPSEPPSEPTTPTVAEENTEDTKKEPFSGVALFGNSQVDGFHIYNSLPGADCLYRVGLNVKSAFEKPMLGEEKPVIDKLAEKQYTDIFLTFGENELGWKYPDIFIEDYRKLLKAVRERQPDAKLYIQSVLPVSAEVSQKNEDNTNNTRIRQYNELLRKLAEDESVTYVDVAAAVQDADGNLPKEAATDGIHPGKNYNKKWADLIAQHVTEGVLE